MSVSSIFTSFFINTCVYFNLVNKFGEQISSCSRAGKLNPWRVQFNWKKVNSLSRDDIKWQSKGPYVGACRTVCHKSTKNMVWRARLVHVAARYRFYNQGGGSEPRVPVSSPAKPSLTWTYISLVQLVTSLKLFAVYIKMSNDRGILPADVSLKKKISHKYRSFLYDPAVTIIGILCQWDLNLRHLNYLDLKCAYIFSMQSS